MLIIEKKKVILILGKGPTQGLDDTMLTPEKEYTINFSEQKTKFCLSLHYNGVIIHIFVNEIYKFKAKDSEISAAPLFLGNVSKKFSIDNVKRLDYTNMSIIFQPIMVELMLMIF